MLRIEDTDAERSTEESYRAIIDALEWLGLDWDEGPVKGGPFGPYVQSARQVLYHTEAQRLIDEGKAYHCFCTTDELEEMRSEAVEKKESSRYDGRCRQLPRDEVAAEAREKSPPRRSVSGCPTGKRSSTTSSAARSRSRTRSSTISF